MTGAQASVTDMPGRSIPSSVVLQCSPAAACLLLAISREGEGEAAELRRAALDVGYGNRPADHEQAVDRAGGDRVHDPELPVEEGALHELEPVRDPVDALEDRGLVAGHRRGAGE